MKFLTSTSLLVLSTCASLTLAGKPVNVQVTLRGKKYSVPNVSTVTQLQENVEQVTGLSPAKQSLLYNGQKLKPDEHDGELEGYGVTDGSVINIVPASKKKSSSAAATLAAASGEAGGGEVTNAGAGAAGGLGGMFGGMDMDKLMGEAGIDKEKLQEMMKDMPGAGENGEMPDLNQSMDMMKDLMNNPMMQQMLTDPERLEQSRQMILNNPMMKSMMAEVPGFSDILNDKEQWRESMLAAADMYKNMDPAMMEQMMQGMAGGFDAGMNNAGMGMGGTPPAAGSSSAALDDLNEGDE
jgi:hypothetical protein